MKTNLIVLFVILFFASCGTKSDVKNNGDDSRFFVDGNSGTISKKNKLKFPDWVEVGVECYGLIVYEAGEDVKVGYPAKLKVINEKHDGYKCETLEDVKMYKSLGCDKLGIKKGETWWETDGDLYKTKEEAVAILKERDWLFEF